MAGSMVPRDIACMAWLLYKMPQMTQVAVQLVRFYCLTEHVTKNIKKEVNLLAQPVLASVNH